MADNDSGQEKTEEPTPKRQQKARDDGEIPRSKDLTTFAVLITSTFGLFLFGGVAADSLLRICRGNFAITRELIFDENLMALNLSRAFGDSLLALMPFFACVALAALIGPTALGGFLFSSKSLAPKWNRMDPIAGIKRMFSIRSLVELFKGIGKVLLIIGIAYVLLRIMQDRLLGLSSEPLEQAIAHALELSLWAAIFMSSATIIISLIDVPFQIWEHTKKMRMSRQEVLAYVFQLRDFRRGKGERPQYPTKPDIPRDLSY